MDMGSDKADLRHYTYPEIPVTAAYASPTGAGVYGKDMMLDDIQVQRDLQFTRETV